MRHGTQEELDAAKDDATKLPFGALFKAKYAITNPSGFVNGYIVYRMNDILDGNECVLVALQDKSDFWFVDANDLEVIK